MRPICLIHWRNGRLNKQKTTPRATNNRRRPAQKLNHLRPKSAFPKQPMALILRLLKSGLVSTKPFFLEFLNDFNDKYADFDKQLAALVKDDDLDGAGRLAHTISGLAGIIGAEELQVATKDLETAFKKGDAPLDTDPIITAHAQAKATLETILAAKNSDTKPDASTSDT